MMKLKLTLVLLALFSLLSVSMAENEREIEENLIEAFERHPHHTGVGKFAEVRLPEERKGRGRG